MVLNERGYSSLELIVAVLTMAVTFYGNALDMGVVGGIYIAKLQQNYTVQFFLQPPSSPCSLSPSSVSLNP